MIDTRNIARAAAKPAKSVVDKLLDIYYTDVYHQRSQDIWEAGMKRIMEMELKK